MKRLILTLLCTAILEAHLWAQVGYSPGNSFDNYHLELTEVTFWDDVDVWGISLNNLFELRNDDTQVNYPTPQWTLTGNASPLVYQSGTKARISAKFIIQCLDGAAPPNSIKMRGTAYDANGQEVCKFVCNDNLDVINTTDGYVIDFPKTRANIAFELHRVRFMPAFSIEWEICISGNCGLNDWIKVEDIYSDNYLYLTWDKPDGEMEATPANPPFSANPAFKHLETIAYLSCLWGNGATAEGQIMTKIFEAFKLHQVTRKDGIPLTYYGTCLTAPANNDVVGLIQSKDGDCYSWQKLFVSLLKFQGFKEYGLPLNFLSVGNCPRVEPVNDVFVSSNGNTGVVTQFLIKDWNFQDLGSNNFWPEFKYYNVLAPENTGTLTSLQELGYACNGTTNNWKYIWNQPNALFHEATDALGGLLGQGEPDPLTYFGNHGLVKVYGKVYDPSYGSGPFATGNTPLSDIQGVKGGMSGWAIVRDLNEANIGIDINGDGLIDPTLKFWTMAISDNPFLWNFQ